jgi:type IV pilus assembly protein PilO
MFKNLPYWGQLAIVIIFSILLFFVAYKFYPNFAEMSRKNDDLQGRLDDKQREISLLQSIEKNLPELEKEIANLKMKLADLKQILPTEPETGDLLKDIKNLIDRANLELKLFDPKAFKELEFYKEFPIRMETVGNYHDLALFFDHIGKYARIINVTDVVINAMRGKSQKTIKSTFNATTFIYKEENQEDEQK